MDISKFGTSEFIAALAVLIAVAGVFFPWWYQRNQLLLEQAIKSLERAYEALTNTGKDVAPPAASRINWLTAARHIARYKKIKAKMYHASLHRLLCDEHEEYWRHQFYLCLNDAALRSSDYYKKAQIEPQSAIIIHGFAEWPKNNLDPVDDEDSTTILEKAPFMLKRQQGLRFYLQSLPSWKTSKKAK